MDFWAENDFSAVKDPRFGTGTLRLLDSTRMHGEKISLVGINHFLD